MGSLGCIILNAHKNLHTLALKKDQIDPTFCVIQTLFDTWKKKEEKKTEATTQKRKTTRRKDPSVDEYKIKTEGTQAKNWQIPSNCEKWNQLIDAELRKDKTQEHGKLGKDREPRGNTETGWYRCLQWRKLALQRIFDSFIPNGPDSNKKGKMHWIFPLGDPVASFHTPCRLAIVKGRTNNSQTLWKQSSKSHYMP